MSSLEFVHLNWDQVVCGADKRGKAVRLGSKDLEHGLGMDSRVKIQSQLWILTSFAKILVVMKLVWALRSRF